MRQYSLESGNIICIEVLKNNPFPAGMMSACNSVDSLGFMSICSFFIQVIGISRSTENGSLLSVKFITLRKDSDLPNTLANRFRVILQLESFPSAVPRIKCSLATVLICHSRYMRSNCRENANLTVSSSCMSPIVKGLVIQGNDKSESLLFRELVDDGKAPEVWSDWLEMSATSAVRSRSKRLRTFSTTVVTSMSVCLLRYLLMHTGQPRILSRSLRTWSSRLRRTPREAGVVGLAFGKVGEPVGQTDMTLQGATRVGRVIRRQVLEGCGS